MGNCLNRRSGGGVCEGEASCIGGRIVRWWCNERHGLAPGEKMLRFLLVLHLN